MALKKWDVFSGVQLNILSTVRPKADVDL